MKAISITEPHKAERVDIPEPPAPAAGEVRLKVRQVGYCGSDLTSFRGLNPMVTYPRIPGHEIGATIEALGPKVPGQWQCGQNVLVSPYSHCGQCTACRTGRVNACRDNRTLGVQRDGALTESIVVPYEKLFTSNSLSLRELALVEPLTVGFHAVARGQVGPDETVAVFGCGAIGLGVIAGAKARGLLPSILTTRSYGLPAVVVLASRSTPEGRIWRNASSHRLPRKRGLSHR